MLSKCEVWELKKLESKTLKDWRIFFGKSVCGIAIAIIGVGEFGKLLYNDQEHRALHLQRRMSLAKT